MNCRRDILNCKRAGVVTTVSHQYLYDNLDRKISVTTTIDGEEIARTATTYDDKGRVATTTMSDVKTDNTNALNYGYLVNGRVKSISTSNGKFEMTLGFASGMYPSYSGNVSSISWRGGDGVNRIYNYRYDKLNRLISAEYYEANRASRSDISYMGSPDYDTSYSYDLQGNVKTISRKGMTGLTPGANNKIVSYGNTDNLTLSYTGNRLKSVTDASSRIYYTGATDFDDAADYDTEYEYDYNGNVTVDRNRKIVGAVYNSLNQPMRIEMEDGAEIENMYDAEGTLRQRKHIGSDDTEIAVTDYSGVWEFKNGALSRINIPGGYIQGDSVYFYIADQQGNIRQVWNASTGQTVQDNHYYPYGAMFGESAAVEYVNAMAGINNIASINAEVSANPYRYGGKEWLMQEGLNYYDFAARQYDPTTGRFIHPDPLNGKYPHLSSYLYCAGNPINATDPSGMVVIASDRQSQIAIRNTLPVNDRDYVMFDENNQIIVSLMESHESISMNYNDLLEMAQNSINIVVMTQDYYLYKDNEGQIHFRHMGQIEYDEYYMEENPIAPTGSTNGDTGFLGKALLPDVGKSGQNSIDNNIYIILNKGMSDLGAAETFSHEGYGHAYLYMKTQDREIAGHDFIEGSKENNKLLVNRIVNSILETIKNFKE